jgi:MFS family permease
MPDEGGRARFEKLMPGRQLTLASFDENDRLRFSLRMITTAWLFGATWMYMAGMVPQTRYAKLMNMPEFFYGIMPILPYFAALVQFPVSYLIERYGHRKGLFIPFGLAHRALWLLVALIPWLAPHQYQWILLLVFIGISSIAGQVAVPAVMSWLADVVPPRVRGRYFAARSQVGQIAGIVTSLAVGYWLDHSQALGNRALLETLSVIFGIAAFSGCMVFICLISVPDVPMQRDPEPVGLWQILKRPLQNRNFRFFLIYNSLMTLGVGAIGQFITLYLFDVAGFDNLEVQLLQIVAPALVTLAGYFFWGRLMDRMGRRPVMLLCAFLVVPGGLWFMFVSPQHWVLPLLLALVSSFAWPGVDVANMSMLLGMSDSRKGGRLGSAYVAINSVTFAIAGTLSGVMFGWIYHRLGTDWGIQLPHYTLTSHGVIVAVSTVIRLMAAVFVIFIVDTESRSTLATANYMVASLYSNLALVVQMPLRGIAALRQMVGGEDEQNDK